MLQVLTAEQWRQAHAMRDDWQTQSLSTNRADRSAAESVIAEMYRLIGRRAPRFVWTESPASAVLAVGVLRGVSLESLADTTRSALPDSLLASVSTSLAGSAGRSSVASLGAPLMDELNDSLGGPDWKPRGASLVSAVRGALAPAQVFALRDLLTDVGTVANFVHYELAMSLRTVLPGSLDSLSEAAGYLSLFDACEWALFDITRRLGVVTYPADDTAVLDLWCALRQAADTWRPYEHVCVLADRPTVLHVEPDPLADRPVRLHCADGPAVAFADGWVVHAWHGTRVPADLVEGGGWPAERILTEPSEEVRRCAVERVGMQRVVAPLTEVSAADDPRNHGQRLALYDLPPSLLDSYGSGDVRLLRRVDGAADTEGVRREVLLPVPGRHTDPVAAAADLYDWPVETYRLLGAGGDSPERTAGGRGLRALIGEHGVQVLEHLDRDAPVPVLTGPQLHGDLSVLPVKTKATKIPIPPFGVLLMGGTSHHAAYSLHGTGFWEAHPEPAGSLVLGTLTVTDGGVVFVAHPEHGYTGIGAGTYRIGRERRYRPYATGGSWDLPHPHAWWEWSRRLPIRSAAPPRDPAVPWRVVKQSFDNIRAAGPETVIENFDLDRCTFVGSRLFQHDDPAPSLVARRITATRCTLNNCIVSGVRFEDVEIDHLTIRGMLHLRACVLSRVTLRGRITGSLLTTPPIPGHAQDGLAGTEQAIVDAYASIDWALDISEAEFTDADFYYVPGDLVRRDPETQFLLRREVVAGLDPRTLPKDADIFLSRFESTPFDTIVAIAPKRSKYFREFLETLQALRRAGLAE